MRLIDADNIYGAEDFIKLDKDFNAYLSLNDLCKIIDIQPTAYDVDAVVEQLEELRELDACDFDNCPVEDINCCDCTQKRMAERAIEIVKAGGNS